MIRTVSAVGPSFGLSLAALFVSALGMDPVPAGAQTVRQVFEKVAPSVAVIRARGRDVTAGGQTRFAETGSGVLISADGKVMTAAHVVHAMDEISVEFLGGETVTARVVASEPAADLSLLQLDRVPPGAKVAPMADSSTMHVGDQVIIVGAPYGLSYSLSVGTSARGGRPTRSTRRCRWPSSSRPTPRSIPATRAGPCST